MDKGFALGRHMTVEYYDCNPRILADPQKLEDVFVESARASGATVLGTNFHSFEPQGVSGFVIIAESHFSVHAWPEHDYAAVDIFTCGESISFDTATDNLQKGLESVNMIVSGDMQRGIVSNNGFERMVPVVEDHCNHGHTLSWEKHFKESNAWGLLASVDIYDCDKAIIRDEKMIKSFVARLCDRIDMKRFDDCVVVDFGEDEKVSGFSMTQFIETSLISGHFANQSNNAYLDIFSCKFFEPRDVAEYAVDFFKGSHYRMQVALRR